MSRASGSRSSTSGRTRSGSSSSPGSTDRLVEAHGRDLRARPGRRGAGAAGALAARADGARARDDRAVRALLPRHGHRARCGRWRPRRSARRPTARSSCARRAALGLEIQVLSHEEEARYGYLAAVNSTTLTRRRRARHRRRLDAAHARRGPAGARDSAPGGSARCVTTERFLARERVKPKHLKALREHVRDELAEARRGSDDGAGSSPASAGRCATSPRRRCSRADLPSYGVQGFPLRNGGARRRWSTGWPSMRPPSAATVPGIKPERGDLILAGAVVVQA